MRYKYNKTQIQLFTTLLSYLFVLNKAIFQRDLLINTRQSLDVDIKRTGDHKSFRLRIFDKQKKIAQETLEGFDWWNLLTKLLKDNEGYLETAKTNCPRYCVDKQAEARLKGDEK